MLHRKRRQEAVIITHMYALSSLRRETLVSVCLNLCPWLREKLFSIPLALPAVSEPVSVIRQSDAAVVALTEIMRT